MNWLKNGRVAQLGEHLLCKQGVAGSIPATSTISQVSSRRESSKLDVAIPPVLFRYCVSCWNESRLLEKNLNQGSLQHFSEEFLLLRGELFALRGEVEHVDSFVTFRVDQRDFDVASEARQR
jgi:hypothetical protein